jgi:hypothetical protein
VLGHLVTDEYAGNFAIKDQRMALVWLKKNIAAFGGNPNDVRPSDLHPLLSRRLKLTCAPNHHQSINQ